MGSWFEETQTRLEGFKELRNNWDAHGGSPITPRSIESTREFLTRLDPDTPRADVVPTSQGGVALSWAVLRGGSEVPLEPEADIALEALSVEFEPEGHCVVDEIDAAELPKGAPLYRAAALARAFVVKSPT